MKEMASLRQPGVAIRGRACPRSLQGYPDECDESPLPQFMECGKPQLYGRAVDTVQAHAPLLSLGCRLEKLYFNQDGIKRGGVAQVGKFFRSQHINIPSLRSEFRPMKPRANHARLQHAVHFGF